MGFGIRKILDSIIGFAEFHPYITCVDRLRMLFQKMQGEFDYAGVISRSRIFEPDRQILGMLFRGRRWIRLLGLREKLSRFILIGWRTVKGDLRHRHQRIRNTRTLRKFTNETLE